MKEAFVLSTIVILIFYLFLMFTYPDLFANADRYRCECKDAGNQTYICHCVISYCSTQSQGFLKDQECSV